MIRNLKALLLAGLAVLALGAIGASSASANFTTEHTAATAFTNVNGGNTVLTTEADGTGTTAHQVLDIPGNGAFTCEKLDLEGTVTGVALTTLTLLGRGAEPLTGCKFLSQPAIFAFNGCDFHIQLPTTVSIKCAAEKAITFSAAGCNISIPAQEMVGHPKFRNLGAGGNDMYVTMETLITGMTATASGAGCITTGHLTGGTYTTGNVLIKGHVDPTGAQKPFTVH